MANRLKRVLPKFRADRSHIRGVNVRSKFEVVVVVRPSVLESAKRAAGGSPGGREPPPVELFVFR